ncbi:MAG: sigma-54-dependent Fis family transcriptional regulator [Gemmatimonadetes bacterium]|nr:sigma-54-dependent Fis family transcriptional regulator [Gemmatimonadota bacterium]
MATILVVDPDPGVLADLTGLLESEGFGVKTAADVAGAIAEIDRAHVDVVITDLMPPGRDCLDLLDHIRKVSPLTGVMIMTEHGTLESAIEVMRRGADDYVRKPLDLQAVAARLKRMLEHRALAHESLLREQEMAERYDFRKIVGESAAMKKVLEMVRRVARTESTVLITGPSGTGKELIARAIHYNSGRRAKPFVAVNCAAIAESLMESELFGHRKGAFTGAVENKQGFFNYASEGTLLLDEIGDMPIALQAKLLRAIESHEIIPVGENKAIPVNTRIIASTNRNLLGEVKRGAFRDDLYYRLNVVEVQLPGLAERAEDIPLLVDHFIEKYNRELRRKVTGVEPETMHSLMSYLWPGGIRELENVIERSMILCDSNVISHACLPPALTKEHGQITTLREAVRLFEGQHIRKMLGLARGDKKEAARLLGVGVSSLYRKIEERRIRS